MMDNQQQKYYVYTYTDPINESVFYVGKGTKNRAFSKNKNHLVKNKILKLELLGYKMDNIVTIVKYFFDEESAFQYEKHLIKNIGIEKLLNMTLGGEGVSSEVARKNALLRSKNKTLFCQTEKGRKFFSDLVKTKVKNGTYVLVKRDENGETVGSRNCKLLIKNKTHYFLTKKHKERTKDINDVKVRDGTHVFLQDKHKKVVSVSNYNRIKNGTLELHKKDENGNTPASRKMKELLSKSEHIFQSENFRKDSLLKKELYKGKCIREDTNGNTEEYISISEAIRENSDLNVTCHSLRYKYINSNKLYKGYYWYTKK